ncbi:MAG TPA: porin family protein [Bacteroidales bacterium]|nr:porin family protein [Bacteroidales bacterium]
MFSVYAGFRLNIVHNEYEGHLTNLMLDIDAKGLDAIGFPDHSGPMNPTPIFGLVNSSDNIPAELKQKLQLPAKMAADGVHLESKQSGWGVAPIVGVHFSHVGINIGAKYEFKNSLNVENKTTVDDTGMFADGVNTAHDSPALFTIGASYDILPSLTASVGYHLFFDKDASMANDKQKHLTDNTNEYLAGIEYRINDMFLISTGGQITRFGATDAFQSDLSFSIDSYSIGFGGAVNLSKNVQLNVGYFFTNYSDYTKSSANYNGTGVPGTDVYSRTNKVFAAGIDFSF